MRWSYFRQLWGAYVTSICHLILRPNYFLHSAHLCMLFQLVLCGRVSCGSPVENLGVMDSAFVAVLFIILRVILTPLSESSALTEHLLAPLWLRENYQSSTSSLFPTAPGLLSVWFLFLGLVVPSELQQLLRRVLYALPHPYPSFLPSSPTLGQNLMYPRLMWASYLARVDLNSWYFCLQLWIPKIHQSRFLQWSLTKSTKHPQGQTSTPSSRWSAQNLLRSTFGKPLPHKALSGHYFSPRPRSFAYRLRGLALRFKQGFCVFDCGSLHL